MPTPSRPRGPVSQAIIIALSKLVDDAQTGRRDPSHNDLEFQISRAGLSQADPAKQGQTVGKAKRVRAVLTWALDHEPEKGEELVAALVGTTRGCGGFDPSSPNFVGSDQVSALAACFKEEGYELGSDGVLSAGMLDSLSGQALTTALKSYVLRAKRGVTDAALLVGTSKDLVEATAKHILVERNGQAPTQAPFPMLLGQAFYTLNLATSADPVATGEHPRRRLERALYEAACAINTLRNQEGTGHGRPWLTTVKDHEARMAVETIGLVSEYLLLSFKPPRS